MRELKKILIIRFSSIGDIVLTSPLVRVLREAYPHAQIDYLVKSEFAELVRWSPHLTSVIELTTSEKSELKALKRRTKEERYDAIIDLHASLRSRYIGFGSGARYVQRVNKRIFKRFLLVKAKKNFYGDIVPVARRYFETVRKFGLQDDHKGLEISLPEGVRTSVASSLSRFQLEKHKMVVGLIPGAKHFTKRWPAERFVEFGTKIAKERHAKILIFGGKEETEYCGDLAHMINASSNATLAESLAGKFSLLETCAALGSCDLVVTNDTGVMHLASAQKRNIVAIFGSTVREFGFFPEGEKSVVVERAGLYCRPCDHVGLEKCPEGHFRCMKEVTADEVLSQAQSLLKPLSSGS